MLKILLIDDHAVVRAGVKQILIDSDVANEVGEASNASEGITKVSENDWHLVVLDIRLPDKSGVELLKEIRSERPKLPVLILSMYPESQYAVRLIHAGAAGYISKDSDEIEILNAVRTAACGKRYLSPTVAELLANHIDSRYTDGQHTHPHKSLSDREYHIFVELASGKRPSDIAEALKVSAKTIATHRTRILKKMGFTNNAQLTLYANEHDLLL